MPTAVGLGLTRKDGVFLDIDPTPMKFLLVAISHAKQVFPCAPSTAISLVPSHEGCRLPLKHSGSSRYDPVDPSSWRWPAPFAPRALPRFVTTTEQSAPNRRIATFGLAIGAACAFSLGIAV